MQISKLGEFFRIAGNLDSKLSRRRDDQCSRLVQKTFFFHWIAEQVINDCYEEGGSFTSASLGTADHIVTAQGMDQAL